MQTISLLRKNGFTYLREFVIQWKYCNDKVCLMIVVPSAKDKSPVSCPGKSATATNSLSVSSNFGISTLCRWLKGNLPILSWDWPKHQCLSIISCIWNVNKWSSLTIVYICRLCIKHVHGRQIPGSNVPWGGSALRRRWWGSHATPASTFPAPFPRGGHNRQSRDTAPPRTRMSLTDDTCPISDCHVAYVLVYVRACIICS